MEADMSPLLKGLISLSETSLSLIDDSKHASLGITDSSLPIVLAHRATSQKLLVVTHSSRRASELVNELSAFSDHVVEFPAWETLPHERLSPNSDTIALRIHALYGIKEAQIIVAPVRAFVQPIIASITDTPLLTIRVGDFFKFEGLIHALTERGYTRVDLVERRGDFAVRGGIIDLFLPLEEHPIRVEFFGDEIEEMRFFEIGDQRTFAAVTVPVEILPCRELLINEGVRARARDLRSDYFELREMCDKISEGIYVEGMESLAAALGPGMKTLIDFLPEGVEIFLIEEERIRNRVLDLVRTSNEFLEASWSNVALEENKERGRKSAPLRSELQNGGYRSLDDLEKFALNRRFPWRIVNAFSDEEVEQIEQFVPVPTYRGDVDRLTNDLRRWLSDGFLTILSLPGGGLVERYVQLLNEAEVPSRAIETISTTPTRGTVLVIASPIQSGYLDEEKKVVILGE
ncbi:MAG: transcription-repair coupling factor, partial [Actinobacteria bacterium]|nr:transcription-repair coupling factor [Actinomycetota bacterium]